MLLSLYHSALCRHPSLPLSFLFVYIFKLLHVNGIFFTFLPFENQHKKLVSSSAFLSNFPTTQYANIHLSRIFNHVHGGWLDLEREKMMALNALLMHVAPLSVDDRSLFLLQQFSFAKWSKLINRTNTHTHTTAGKLPMLPRLPDDGDGGMSHMQRDEQ